MKKLNASTTTSSVILILLLSLVLVSGCKSKTIVKSQPMGDFVQDTRNPNDVCLQIQRENRLDNCKIIEAKTSMDKKECVDGMSVAGCFVCKYNCEYI